MNCPYCNRHMSAWSLGPPGHAPAWRCPNCDITISDDEAGQFAEMVADVLVTTEKDEESERPG